MLNTKLNNIIILFSDELQQFVNLFFAKSAGGTKEFIVKIDVVEFFFCSKLQLQVYIPVYILTSRQQIIELQYASVWREPGNEV